MNLFKSFRVKVTLILVFSMLLACLASDLVIYKYALERQFQDLRSRLMTVAQISALMIDGDLLSGINLTKDGVDDPAYKKIADKLLEIKRTVPSITYIYTLTKSAKPGIFNFIVDPEPKGEDAENPGAYPGEEYDAANFPELSKGWKGPAADKKLGRDEWGVFMSGYAPVRNSLGDTVAILGIDMSAEDVKAMEREVARRVRGILIFATLFSVLLGAFISSRVAHPISKLVLGTRHIAKGELDYKMPVSGDDEIAELGRSFNSMARDLKVHIEELNRTTAEKERLLKELEIAKGIQQSFLPTSAPVMDRIDISAVTTPARVVGGDFYDFIPFGKDRWGLVVADVSGKGMPAALFMALSRTLVHASAAGVASPAAAIERANKLIIEDNRANMFVTLFYAIVDSSKMSLDYVNAGHNPPIIVGERPGDVVLLKAQGVPLGLSSELKLEMNTVRIKSGNVVTLYTDGVTEAINDDGDRFETERLAEVVNKNRLSSAGGIIISIQDEIRRFVGKQPQFDDITLMVLKAL